MDTFKLKVDMFKSFEKEGDLEEIAIDEELFKLQRATFGSRTRSVEVEGVVVLH